MCMQSLCPSPSFSEYIELGGIQRVSEHAASMWIIAFPGLSEQTELGGIQDFRNVLLTVAAFV